VIIETSKCLKTEPRLEESKRYHSNGALMRHCFYLDGAIHGQELAYDRDGNIERVNFWIHANLHGDQIGSRYEEIPRGRYFYYYKGKIDLIDIPWLPKKPPRKPFNSGRTRIDTLEVS